MIKAILIFNNHGKPRVSKFYDRLTEAKQQEIIAQIFKLISRRTERMCSFVEGGKQWGPDTKVVYRQYATLYFAFWVDSSESELGILDLIQVVVEALDQTFPNVCELDIIFNMDKVHYLLDEVVMGGMVLETDMKQVISSFREQEAIVKDEDSLLVSGVESVMDKIKKR